MASRPPGRLRRNATCNYWSTPLSHYRGVDRAHAPYFFDWLAHPTADDYWRAFSVDLDAIAVPALHIGGWYDAFVRGNIVTFKHLRRVGAPEELRRRQKVVDRPLDS